MILSKIGCIGCILSCIVLMYQPNSSPVRIINDQFRPGCLVEGEGEVYGMRESGIPPIEHDLRFSDQSEKWCFLEKCY